MNGTLFGKRVFAGVIKVKGHDIRRSSWIRPGWVLIPMISILTKDTQKKEKIL